jgi:acyl carrier protein
MIGSRYAVPSSEDAMGLDSVELVLAIERDFSVDIPDEAAERIITVRHMRDFLVDGLRRRGRDADPDAVFAQLRNIIVDQLPVKPSQVVLDAEFIRDFRID